MKRSGDQDRGKIALWWAATSLFVLLAAVTCGRSFRQNVLWATETTAVGLPLGTSSLLAGPAETRAPWPTSIPGPPLEPAATSTPSGSSKVHRVRPGETLSQIALLYGVSPDAIAAASHLIYAGQLLTIPLTTTMPVETPHYIFPVQPPGIASYGEYHHDYPAADIFAPAGSPVVAVTDGVVHELSAEDRWDPTSDDPSLRGGRFVSIIGDDGVRYYYSHLAAVVPWLKPGMRVAAGQLIGYVGNSGNARYTQPHLHFGLSHPPTTPGDWAVRRGEVSPYRYLRAWEQGENLVPVLP